MTYYTSNCIDTYEKNLFLHKFTYNCKSCKEKLFQNLLGLKFYTLGVLVIAIVMLKLTLTCIPSQIGNSKKLYNFNVILIFNEC